MSHRIAVGLALSWFASAWAQTTPPAEAGSRDHRRAGDVLSFALPAGVAVTSWWRDRERDAHEPSELVSFAISLTATLAATEVLKRSVKSERPDGSDRLSFPSGHAARAFGAASFVHRRQGWDAAWPYYAAATYVGWTRVQAQRHRWADIAGSLGVSTAMNWWLVAPPANGTRRATVVVEPQSVSVQLMLPM
jgi:membrane-associated phospholipid phosphatase